MKTSEIQIAAIHNVEGARLRDKQIECVDIVDLAFGNMDKRGDIAPQIHQRMEFDRPLGAAKMGPGEDGKTKIDGEVFSWGPKDTFTAPVFSEIDHSVANDAFMICIHDKPLQEKLGYYEERHR